MAAVGLGGDADTVGSMCGQLCGALHGSTWIPTRWYDAIENGEHGRDYAIGLVAELSALDLHDVPLNCVVGAGAGAGGSGGSGGNGDGAMISSSGGGASASSSTYGRDGSSPATCRRESEAARESEAYKSVVAANMRSLSSNPVESAAGSSPREFAAAFFP